MNKTQAIQQQQPKWNLSQQKQYLDSSTQVQKTNRNAPKDFHQDMLQLVKIQQDTYKKGQQSTTPYKEQLYSYVKHSMEGNDEDQASKNNLSNHLKEENNLYLRTHQKVFLKNNNNNTSPKLFCSQIQDSAKYFTAEKSKAIPSNSQPNKNHDNQERATEIINIGLSKEAGLHKGNIFGVQTAIEEEGQLQNKMKKMNLYPTMNSKFSNTTYNEKIMKGYQNYYPTNDQKEEQNKKLDPLSRVRLINHSTQNNSPNNSNNSQQLEKNNKHPNKIFAIKDIKFDISQIDTFMSHQQSKQINQRNSLGNSIKSQRNIIQKDIDSYDINKAARSFSSSNNSKKRRNSATVNNQQLQNNKHDQKGFSSFLSDYFSTIKELSPKYNNLINSTKGINQLNRNEHSPEFTPQSIQLNFPIGHLHPNQQIYSLKTQKNTQGTISIQALIPSSSTPKLLKSSFNPISTNNNIAHQSLNQEETDNVKRNAQLSTKNKNQITPQIVSLTSQFQNFRSEENLELYEQGGNSTNNSQVKLPSTKSFTEMFSHYRMKKQSSSQKILPHNHKYPYKIEEMHSKQINAPQNNQGDNQIQQLIPSREEEFLSTKDKLQQHFASIQSFKQYFQSNKLSDSLGPHVTTKQELSTKQDTLHIQKESGLNNLSARRSFASLPQTFNGSSSSLTATSRHSLASISVLPKKKQAVFSSQRDFSTLDQIDNHIDIAPFTIQNKENTHLQNLMQRTDDQSTQLTQISQPKYRYLNSNISFDQSVDKEDEDLYNYTQNLKQQNQNSLSKTKIDPL